MNHLAAGSNYYPDRLFPWYKILAACKYFNKYNTRQLLNCSVGFGSLSSFYSKVKNYKINTHSIQCQLIV